MMTFIMFPFGFIEFRDEIQSSESESHSKYSNLDSPPEIELNSFVIKNY